MKRPFQPSNLKRNRTHGFRARMEDKNGRLVLKRRRQKGRWKLTVSDERRRFDIVSADLKRRNLFVSLKSKKNISLLFTTGKKCYGSGLMLRYLAGLPGCEKPQLLVAVPKKWGNAVKRNRYKRQVKAALYEILTTAPLPDGITMAVMPKLPAPEPETGFTDLKADLIKALKSGGWPAGFGKK